MVNGSVLLLKNMRNFFRDESAVGVLLSETVNVGMIQNSRGGFSSVSDVFAIGASGSDDRVCRGVACDWTCGASCAQGALTESHARTIHWKSRNRIVLRAPTLSPASFPSIIALDVDSLNAGPDSVQSQRTRSHHNVTGDTIGVPLSYCAHVLATRCPVCP
jgi:hypothetical protein